MLRDYSTAQVVPFALLVLFVGAAASSIVFGERFGPLRLAGMVTVVCGIAIMLLSKRLQVAALPKIRVRKLCRNRFSQPLWCSALSCAFTPGPNNIMVLSSGLTYGFRRTLPHIAGVGIGVSLMVASVGLGLGAIFVAYPVCRPS